MAGSSHPPPLRVHLSREDQEWLAKFARHENVGVYVLVNDAVHYFRNWQEKGKQALEEMLETIDSACTEYEKQVRRLRYFQREYQLQSRRVRDMRREYEKRLRHEHNLRRAYEQQIRRYRDYYEPLVRAEPRGNALYSPKVARLLALAVCSESDGEANAAFAKARALHHPKALLVASAIAASLASATEAGLSQAGRHRGGYPGISAAEGLAVLARPFVARAA